MNEDIWKHKASGVPNFFGISLAINSLDIQRLKLNETKDGLYNLLTIVHPRPPVNSC